MNTEKANFFNNLIFKILLTIFLTTTFVSYSFAQRTIRIKPTKGSPGMTIRISKDGKVTITGASNERIKNLLSPKPTVTPITGSGTTQQNSGIDINAILAALGVSASGVSHSGGGGFEGGVVADNTKVESVSPASCSKIVDISSLRNVLYKSENLHGSRGMTILFQNPNERPGKKKLEMRNCSCNKKVGYFGLYATDYPYGARYYQQTGGSGNQLSTILGKLGGKCLLVEGKGKWIKVPDATKRSGSITK